VTGRTFLVLTVAGVALAAALLVVADVTDRPAFAAAGGLALLGVVIVRTIFGVRPKL
jgi:hypothetical protein